MQNSRQLEDGLRRAYELAYFIHREKAVSLEIAKGALAKLEVAATAQAKRLYYSPVRGVASRIRRGAIRSKVSLDDLPLLQRLVYIESEAHERQTEAEAARFARSPSRNDMVVRFIKHLVQITVKRNSFYVALGMGRLLHNYTTAEVIRIHDALLADPDRAKGEDYFRARKAFLLRELKTRFGEFIKTTHREHGEERFDADVATQELALLVVQSLDRFTPWNTSCPPETENIHHREEDENRVEVNQMHAVLHPNCYRRLAESLGLDRPDSRLEIPRFSRFDKSGENRSSDDRQPPPALSERELTAAVEQLASEAARRKKLSAGLLRIFVDGTEQGCFDSAMVNSLRVEVGKEAELIEVRGRDQDGDVLLAACVLTQGREGRTRETAVVLEAGQRVSFFVRPTGGEDGGALVDVRCSETSVVRAIQRVASRVSWPATILPALRPAVRLTALILLAVVVGLSVRWLAWAPKIEQTAGQRQTTPTKKSERPGTNQGQSEVSPSLTPELRQPEAHVAEQQPLPGLSPEGGVTRAIEPVSAAVSLSKVKRVFVDCREREVRNAFQSRLASSGRFSAVENQDEAEAALQISVSQSTRGDGKGRVITVQLVGPAGEALWPAAGKGAARRFRGSPEDAASNVVQELLKAVAPSGQKP